MATTASGSPASADSVVVTCLTVPELRSNQEEADMRLLLHAHHAATHHESAIVVRSPDTDVVVLCCHFQRSIPKPMYFRTGTRQRTRYVDISAVSAELPEGMCVLLPGLHALTGSDATSAFVGKGKTAVATGSDIIGNRI